VKRQPRFALAAVLVAGPRSGSASPAPGDASPSSDIRARGPSGFALRTSGHIPSVSEYAAYPSGDKFEPWQDHDWPEHCSAPAAYLGEVGCRELEAMSGGDLETFLREHDAEPVEGHPIALEMVPPHAPPEGEAWESTIHHFCCGACGWDLLLWDAA
jgi:hypothetical protein